MRIIKLSETVSLSDLFSRFLSEGKTPQQAAEQVLGILTHGAFDAMEEPLRGQAIQKAIERYSKPQPTVPLSYAT